MSKPPIKVVIPPKDSGKKTHHKPTRQEQQQKFVNYYTQHGYENLKSQWGDIVDIAKQTGLDPVYLAAYLMTHGGIHNDYNRILLMAESESAKIGTTRGRDKATGRFLDKSPVKNYQYNMGGSWGYAQTKKEGKAALDQGRNDPVVLYTKNGKIPVTRSQLADERDKLNDLFQQYLGRNASVKEVKLIVAGQWSQYKLEKWLTQKPGFFKGTVWKSQAPQLVSDWETVYGAGNMKPPKDLIREAILRGAGGSYWFQDQIRKLPQYKQSVEYKGLYAGYQQQYSQVYGELDAAGKKLIDDAIMHRITPDAFATSLRQRPEFASSFGMQDTWNELGNMFGSIFGGYRPPAKPQQPGQQPPAQTQPPPDQTQPPKRPKPRPGQRPPYTAIPANARSGI